MIGLVVRLQVQDGKQAEFEATGKELVAAVNANEPGVQLYALHRTDDPCKYVFIESYDSEESLEAHGKTEHYRRLGKGLGACLAGAPDIERFTRV